MKVRRPPKNWAHAVCEVGEFCKIQHVAKGQLVRPMQVAREIAITRLEAELALRYLVAKNRVGYRGDGRYFWRNDAAA